MMKFLEYENIIIFILCIIGNTRGEEAYQSTVLSVTSSVSHPILKTTPYFTQTEQTISTTTDTEGPEVAPTQDPGPRLDLPGSNLSPFSHQPETSSIPQVSQNVDSEITDISKQTNSINDIFDDDDNDESDDTFSNINEKTASTQIENTVKDVPLASLEPVITESQAPPFKDTETFIEETSQNKENDDSVEFEPWKVGVISVAAFLAVQTMVFAVYCFMCKKRRRMNIVKNCDQDSEAGVTINVESNDNTVTGEEGTINGGPGQNGLASIKFSDQQEAQQQERVDMHGKNLDKKSTNV
ncbi:uncharacterized protein [Engystomops pustulosus]|uniref:uncharacterized protein n=1 Tax=Engystomops pustulosus TaxID=76066 RepID=UPI003AFB03B1